jgi:hypothetical protein
MEGKSRPPAGGRIAAAPPPSMVPETAVRRGEQAGNLNDFQASPVLRSAAISC